QWATGSAACQPNQYNSNNCLVVLVMGSPTVTVTASTTQNSNNDLIRWTDLWRDPTDVVDPNKSNIPVSAHSGLTTTFAPGLPGNFILVAYVDNNGNGQFDPRADTVLNVVTIAIIKITVTVNPINGSAPLVALTNTFEDASVPGGNAGIKSVTY